MKERKKKENKREQKDNNKGKRGKRDRIDRSTVGRKKHSIKKEYLIKLLEFKMNRFDLKKTQWFYR